MCGGENGFQQEGMGSALGGMGSALGATDSALPGMGLAQDT